MAELDGSLNIPAGSSYKIGGVTQTGTSKWTQGSNDNVYRTAGNVGIGTAAPGAKLEISLDNELGGGHLYITNPNTAFTGKISDITFRIADSVGTIKPAAYIQAIPHNVNLTTGAGLAFWTRKLDVTPTEAMRIDNVGNVGIGTTVPSEKLEVDGNIKADSIKLGTYTILYNEASDNLLINHGQNGAFYITPNGVNLKGIVNVGSPPVYADRSAALAGGLNTGDLYRTGDILKVVY